MATEVAMLFDSDGKTIAFFKGDSSASIPDAQALWELIWNNREQLAGIAHTHPWEGRARASETDRTTWSAIERALGKRLIWPVVTFSDIGYYKWVSGESYWISNFIEGLYLEGVLELLDRSK